MLRCVSGEGEGQGEGEIGCGPDGIVRGERRVHLESQADVDALAGCTEVEGQLFILGDDIVDLRPLSNLRRVSGELGISDADLLTSVAGLEGLREVGALGFGSNDSLETLDGLSSLHVEINLSVSNNASLTSIEGLSGLTLGEGYEGHFEIGIMRNSSLASLAGVEFVGAGGPGLNIQVSGNDALVDLGALGDVEELSALRLYENSLLESLEPLSSLTTAAYVQIEELPVESLRGLEGLRTLTELSIGGNPALADLSALSSLEDLGSLGVGGNPALTSLGLPPLPTVDVVRVSGNPLLVSLGSNVLGQGSLSQLYLGGPLLVDLSALSRVDSVSRS